MKQNNVDEERFPAKQTQWFISGCKEDGLRAEEVEVRSDEDRRKVEISLYEEQCQREGVVDFGELMLRSYELLRDNDPIREHYQRRFRHILIDEFQDTNKLQYAWIKMLAGRERALGARRGRRRPEHLCLSRRARGQHGRLRARVRDAHQIKLEQNYRSYSNILDSANQLISHNKTRLGKNLRTDQGPGEPVRVYEAPTDLAEAQWMVEEMRHLVREGTDARRSRCSTAATRKAG